MMTNVFHIAYCPELKEAVLHYWGCNFKCLGCCRKRWIYDYMLKETVAFLDMEPTGIVKPPERFLDFEEVMKILGELELKRVLHQGQEASTDPQYPRLAKSIHEKFGSQNILYTNAYNMPPLEDTDQVGISFKAFTDSLHRHYTGKSNKRVLKNFIRLYQSGMKLKVSFLLIPDYIDADENERIAKFIASVDKDIPYHILPYFKAGDNPWRRPIHDEIDKAVSLARRHLTSVFGVYGNEELLYEVVSIFPDGVGRNSKAEEYKKPVVYHGALT